MLKRLKEKLLHYTWTLAYFNYNPNVLSEGLDFTSIHIVKNPYKKKWFADPYILINTNDFLTLLVEEFDSEIKRGRIAQILIDKNRDEIVSCDIILDLPTHLSFPAIYRVGKRVIVHPENSASGASYMYIYDEKEKSLINPVKVIDEPVTDAVIIKIDNVYRMYATRLPDPNGKILKSYVSANLMGPYVPCSEERYQHCQARMAGLFIENNKNIIRPAQDCDGSYGKAVVFYDGYSILGEIRSNSIKYAGIHTFNTLGKIGVIDLKRYDYPLFVMFKDLIKRFLLRK